MNLVEVKKLSKRFEYRVGLGDKKMVSAVEEVSFEVAKGEVYSLLGPNGAGKTTTIKMLCTLVRPTSGDALIAGRSVMERPEEVRGSIGVMLAGDRNMYWKLTAKDNLQYFAALYHMPPREAKERIDGLLKLVSLQDQARVPVENYSTGMRIRLSFVKALLNDAPVLMFDEPTSNLDPQSARLVREVIHGLRDQGKSIILTTHNLSEADRLSDRIGIMDRGRIIATGTSSELKRLQPGSLVTIRLRRRIEAVPSGLSGLPGVQRVSVSVDPDTGASVLSVVSSQDPEVVALLLKALKEAGAEVDDIAREEPTLEDVFIGLTGRELRD